MARSVLANWGMVRHYLLIVFTRLLILPFESEITSFHQYAFLFASKISGAVVLVLLCSCLFSEVLWKNNLQNHFDEMLLSFLLRTLQFCFVFYSPFLIAFPSIL